MSSHSEQKVRTSREQTLNVGLGMYLDEERENATRPVEMKNSKVRLACGRLLLSWYLHSSAFFLLAASFACLDDAAALTRLTGGKTNTYRAAVGSVGLDFGGLVVEP